MKSRVLVVLLGMTLLGTSLAGLRSIGLAAEPPEFSLDADLPYTAKASAHVTYDVEFSVIVTAPYRTHSLKVWIPIPPSDAAQEVRDSQWSVFPTDQKPRIGAEPVFGNQFAYFEFQDPQGALILRHRYQIRVAELNWNLQPEDVQPVPHWPATFDRYRRTEEQAVVVDERFERLLPTIVPKRKTPLENFTQVLNWVQQNFEYDHEQASLSASSVHALLQRRGHCSDYHGFCAAMGRVLGYPTRVTYGINSFPKNSPSHCKLEVFLPPYGWVSFDVSETQRLCQAISKAELSEERRQALIAAAQRRLLRGFRDNTWFLQTRGTDYDLSPPAARRAAVVRTAYIEADGEALPEPDPADAAQTKFSWMTAHRYTPDRAVVYPFKNWQSLDEELERND